MLSAQMLFCDECGAANPLQETTCFACRQMLAAPIRAAQPVNIQNNASTALSTSTDALAPGFLLAQRYIIVREVGQGGFGIVYEAKDCQRKSRSVSLELRCDKNVHIGIIKRNRFPAKPTIRVLSLASVSGLV